MIKGLVQGVGFRPFIYRLATMNQLRGKVVNRNNGVLVEVEGEEGSFLNFRDQILISPPAASIIKSMEVRGADLKGFENFTITASRNSDNEVTEICPDIAVCPECLEDLQNDHARLDYPFINCTACGPRFTIVEGLPYDRHMTSMKVFPMCAECKNDYDSISGRRFHAQPVACNSCGPEYLLTIAGERIEGTALILDVLSKRISKGQAVAIKGMGGYHLVCNAFDNKAVCGLRKKKQRDGKPFAVMFRDILSLEEYCRVSPAEYRELASWRRPVVILRQKKELAGAVNNSLNTIGAMLPYLPFHYLLFSKLETVALVMTSGNISEAPLITDDEKATELLMPVAGAVLSHNRRIVNRADDSVVRLAGEKISLIRRSRGYVPAPVDINLNAEGIIAFGAELKNTFCIGKNNQGIMSQYIGDLKNPETYEFLCESVSRFADLFRFIPASVACDMHPDYLSTIHSEKLAQKLSIPLIRVQHHHAHLASCMAENKIDEKIIGVCLDGTGFGTDGNLWGGEFLVSDLHDFIRFAHFDYVPVPGGDKAIVEPWRMAFSYIYKYFGKDFDYSSIGCFRKADSQQLILLKEMIDGNINSPLSSGAGRLFDAIAAILGLCSVSGFDSEAPMRLECAVKNESDDYYPYTTGSKVIFSATLNSIIEDLGTEDISLIAVKFHNTVAHAIADMCKLMRFDTSLNRVILSGGVFQNKYLLEKTTGLLCDDGFEVFTNHLVPANDGGISLGQLAIASKIREQCV